MSNWRVARRELLKALSVTTLGEITASSSATAGGTEMRRSVEQRDSSDFTLQQRLNATDGDESDFFGSAVAVSDDATTAVIGAPNDEDPNGQDAGSAYVFTESNGRWTEQQKLVANDGDDGDNFGVTVSISGDGTTVVIGTPDDEDPNGQAAGSAYVFRQSQGEWSQQQKLTPEDGDTTDLFGRSVSVSDTGRTAVIGAPRDEDPNGQNAGSTYVFTESNGIWTEQQKLSSNGSDSTDFFGQSVSMSDAGLTAVVGAPGGPNAQDTGSAYIFRRSQGEWNQQQKLSPSDGEASDNFGFSVSVSGNGTAALIGAVAHDISTETDAGAAYVFAEDNGIWNQQQKLTATDGDGSDFFGNAVTISDDGTTAVIGAFFDNNSITQDTGSVYVFQQMNNAWNQRQKLTATDGDEDDNFGNAVAVSEDGTTTVIGAESDEDLNNSAAGSAYVFNTGESGIIPYTDENGVVDNNGLNTAISDYLSNDLSDSQLNQVINSYLSGKPI